MRYKILIPRFSDTSPIKVAISHAKALRGKGLNVTVLYLFSNKDNAYLDEVSNSVDFNIEKVSLFNLFSADILHSHCIQPNILIGCASKLLKFFKIKTITTVHTNIDIDLNDRLGVMSSFISKLWKAAICRHDKIFCLNSQQKGQFSNHKNRLYLVPNFLDIEPKPIKEIPPQFDQSYCDFLKYCEEDNLELLATWCVVRQVKNIPFIIEFLKENPMYALVLIGDGPELPHIRDLVDKYNIRRRVYFTGFSVSPYYYVNSASVALFPSFSEGFPIAILEAFHWGIPPVMSKIPSFTDYYNDLNGGFFEIENMGSFASALNYVINNKNDIIINNRITLENKFSKVAIADKIMRAINE